MPFINVVACYWVHTCTCIFIVYIEKTLQHQEIYESPHKEFVKRLPNMISFTVVSLEFLRFWVEKRCREMICEHIETTKPFINHSLWDVCLLKSRNISQWSFSRDNPSVTPYTRDCSHRHREKHTTNKNSLNSNCVFCFVWSVSLSDLVGFRVIQHYILWVFFCTVIVFGRKSPRIWEHFWSSIKGGVFVHT